MENQLVAILPRADRKQLLASGERVELILGAILCQAGKRFQHAFFPTGGVISMAASLDERASLDVGLVGDEGFVGIPLALGVQIAPLQGIVQVAGSAWRMEAAVLTRALDGSAALRRVLHHYVHVVLSQLALAVVCTRHHLLEARLACLLLMTADRARTSELHITHELLADLLGVRRVGVTRAASALRERGVIRYSRGDIQILERGGLEVASCSCYRSARKIYDGMLSPPGRAARPARA